MTFLEAAMIMMSGGSKVIRPINITENGEYSAPVGVDGYSPVNVKVPDRYNEGYADGKNAGYEAGFTAGADSVVIKPLSVTENGPYHAAEYGCKGFDPVNANVPDRYDDGYADGYTDGYNGGYDTSFGTAGAYYNDPDLSKNYYVYIGLEGGAKKAIFCHWYDTADMKAQQPQMCWIYNVNYSYDPKIISIKWVKVSDIKYNIAIKAMGYNSNHSETKTITFTYGGLRNGITPSNSTIGSVKYN